MRRRGLGVGAKLCPKWFVVTALAVEIAFFERQSAPTPKGGFRSAHTTNRTFGLSGQPLAPTELRAGGWVVKEQSDHGSRFIHLSL